MALLQVEVLNTLKLKDCSKGTTTTKTQPKMMRANICLNLTLKIKLLSAQKLKVASIIMLNFSNPGKTIETVET